MSDEPRFGEWHPIETAPKDGTKFLTYRDGDIAQTWWKGDPSDGICTGFGNDEWYYTPWDLPTHWMALPPPPGEVKP